MRAIRVVEVLYPGGRRYVFAEWVGDKPNTLAPAGCRVTEYVFEKDTDYTHTYLEPVQTWRDNNGYQ